MKKFLIAFLLIPFFGVFAQKMEIRDLQRRLAHVSERKDSVDILNRLSILSHLRYRDSCLYYADKALVKARSIGYKKGIADALNGHAVYHVFLNNYQSAKYFSDALAIYREIGDKENECQILMSTSVLLAADKNEKEAKEYIYMAEKISRGLKRDSLRSIIIGNILSLDKSLKPERYAALMDEGMKIARKYNDYRMILLFMNNEARLKYKSGDKKNGLEMLVESEKIADSVGCELVRVWGLMSLGDLSMAEKNTDDGLKYYKKGFEVSNTFGYPELAVSFAEKLYLALADQGRVDEAMQYASEVIGKYRNIRDESHKSGYNYVTYVQNENEIKKLDEEQRFWILLIVFLVISKVCLMIILYLLWRFYKGKRKLAETQIQLKESLESQKSELESRNNFKQMLITVLAHDVRQPFTNMIMAADMLSEHPEVLTEDDRKRLFRDLKLHAEQSIFFMDGILYWIKASKQDDGLLTEKVRVSEVLADSDLFLEPIRKSRDINLINKIPSDLEMSVNKLVLTFAVRNILHNAIKFSPDGSEIILDYQIENGKAIISIKDFGRGMTKKMKDQLFTPVLTEGGAFGKGAGVAMAIAYEMLDMIGCRIWLESELQKGTTFYIECPI